ncbi:Thiamine_BP domain-containing protein [Candidatus Hydrogenisulfobacillus filiaventi]|uniref:Thiamine_BP domain-containing protein n=1 Tax=Candidatus Hydrogenisulfobacillus filiaventi TaxID=2707344 RepID=A0A6F8ZE04_9FIRM|nr:MTH1187 family thiamine-binding protein [Bacillota bacterium]CAB1127997.1 Thiamine_BP domain-containing protein [Candidatus Hydrogenisulfobacillus filiaventi]
MAVVEVQVWPVGTDHASVSSYIARCYRLAEQAPGVAAQLTPTATILEGDLDRVWEVVRQMHAAPFEQGADRVVTTVTIDDRQDKAESMEAMVSAVMEEVHRPEP